MNSDDLKAWAAVITGGLGLLVTIISAWWTRRGKDQDRDIVIREKYAGERASLRTSLDQRTLDYMNRLEAEIKREHQLREEAQSDTERAENERDKWAYRARWFENVAHEYRHAANNARLAYRGVCELTGRTVSPMVELTELPPMESIIKPTGNKPT